MRITDKEIAAAVIGAGFTGSDAITAVAVALAESGGNPTATNKNSNGSTDFGLFQINSVHRGILSSGNWQNPRDNARMAKQVFDQSKGWTPWVAWKQGKHTLYLTRAKAAISGAGEVPNTEVPLEDSPAPEGQAGITGFLNMVQNPNTWARVGYFLAGIILLGVALFKLSSIDNKLRDAAMGVAKTVVTKKVSK